MKKLLLLIFVILPELSFSQNDDDPILIQNFYTTCKSKNFAAFNAVNTGIQLFDTKQYSRSLKNFEKALSKDSTLCDAWYLIGYCYQKNSEYEKSIEACNKSLDLNPSNPSALIIKGNTFFLKKDTIQAIDQFRKAKTLLPDIIDAYYGLALLYHLSGNDKDAKTILLEMDSQGAKTPKVRDNKKIKDLKELLK